MDREPGQFQTGLLKSVRDIKAGRAARKTKVEPNVALVARAKVGVSQGAFAALLGVSVRTTLQDWEQGRREPTRAAQTLLRVAAAHPEALRDLPSA